MKEKKLDCVILTTGRDMDYNNNIFYYTGFKGYALLVVKQKSASLLVPEMEFEKGKKTGFKTIALKEGKKDNILKKTVGKSKIIGIDEMQTSIASFKALKKLVKAKWRDISVDLFKIRSVKDNGEIKKIEKACHFCDNIFKRLLLNFNFKTEKELATFIEMEMRKKGYEPSFPPIVASGKNSSIVHHNNEGKIRKGFLLLDFGVKMNGYCSDMSRTIYLGKPSKKEIEVYDNLLYVQEAGVRKAIIGKRCGDIDKEVREVLGDKFMHGLGHGVGLDIHEMPNLLPESKDVLKEGNIITIEPGVYYENKFGIRIEDTILITKKGPKRLTRSKKELIIVGN